MTDDLTQRAEQWQQGRLTSDEEYLLVCDLLLERVRLQQRLEELLTRMDTLITGMERLGADGGR